MAQYDRHKKAVKIFRDITSNPENYLIIQYSCESFVDKEDGRTPRITTIAVRYFESSQTKTFSIHEVAEQKNVAIDKIEENYDSLELEMLSQYFEFVQKHERYKWIHWNMRDSNYGFYAIENRYRVLGGQPIIIPDDKKIDLARNLVNCFGRGYIGNPRMEKLVDKNHMTKLGFLTGKEEAEAFEKNNISDFVIRPYEKWIYFIVLLSLLPKESCRPMPSGKKSMEFPYKGFMKR